MRYRGCVSNTFYFDVSVNCIHAHFAVKIARFNAEGMGAEFPNIKTKPYHNRKMRMNAGKVTRNYRIEGSDNSQLPAVFLREIAKSKKFYFNIILRGNLRILSGFAEGSVFR